MPEILRNRRSATAGGLSVSRKKQLGFQEGVKIQEKCLKCLFHIHIKLLTLV